MAGSSVDILSLMILSMRIKPTRNLFCSNSDKVLTLRFPKWSTWSALALGLLFNLITSFTTSARSSIFKILFSFPISFVSSFLAGAKLVKRCQVFHRPTFERSYRSKLKNILKIKSWAVSGVTKSPGRNLLYISTNASFWSLQVSLFSVSFIYCTSPVSTSLNSFSIFSILSKPKAINKVVAGTFLFLFILTPIKPDSSVSNSSQAPLFGIIFAPKKFLPRELREVKKAPGDLISWETTTLSTPFTTKVPRSVIRGKSQRNTSCSFTSLVFLFTKRILTLKEISKESLFLFASKPFL